jgi:hypothetical protein
LPLRLVDFRPGLVVDRGLRALVDVDDTRRRVVMRPDDTCHEFVARTGERPSTLVVPTRVEREAAAAIVP